LEKRITLGGSSSSTSKGGGKLGMQSLALEMAEQARLDKVLRGGGGGGGGGGGKGKGKATSSMIMGEVPSIYRPTPLSYSNEEAEESIDSILTPFQIQQFEAETSALLNSTESDLKALQKAETSLLEISALQSQLAIHLTQQSELTDQLWAESVEVTGKVTEGNVQLKKARERNREGRVWLLIFLVGASLSLLFLDYYT
jgi:syntaxin 18